LLRSTVNIKEFVRFFVTKGGGGVKNLEKLRTYYVGCRKFQVKFRMNIFILREFYSWKIERWWKEEMYEMFNSFGHE
jgi:hypothetical protein